MCSSSGGQNCIIQFLATYRCDDTRDCIIQFCPPDDEHMCSKHVEALNKPIITFSASSWLILRNKYIQMHGQQNIKKKIYIYIYCSLTLFPQQSAAIPLHRINRLVSVVETGCLLRGTNYIY